MNQLKTEEAFREQIASSKPTIVVFKTTWCKDCHYIEPFMPELEQLYAERLTFVHIDRDDLPELCSEYNILGIPSFIVFRKGQELTRFVSKLRKSRDEITAFLDQSVAVADALSN